MNGAAEFQDFIAARGFQPPERIEPGHWIRFATKDKQGDEAGSAKLFPDCEGGIVFDWRTGDSWTWQTKNRQEYTEAERRTFRERIEREQQEAKRIEVQERQNAADRARTIWSKAQPAPSDHAYLAAKGIQPHGARIYAGPLAINAMRCHGALILPVRGADGSIQSLEFIAQNGDKRFLPAGAKAGGYYPIGKPAGRILIAEGFATGAAVHEATGCAVAVAFDAGNLERVASAMRAKFADAEIVIAADDDSETICKRHKAEGATRAHDPRQPRPEWCKCNPGLSKALQAALAVGGKVAVPATARAADFNDLAQAEGAHAVNAAIEGAIKPEPPKPDSGIRYRRASEIEAVPINWLWRNKFARGKVSMLAGNPGLGKSQITASMAAIVSTGGRWPVDRTRCTAGNVVFLSAEDDAADTIRPRLESAGADLRRAFILDAVSEGFRADGAEIIRAFNLSTDLNRLGALLEEIGGAALVVIDPISAYLGDANSHNNAEVRALLAPLGTMAAKHGAAIVCVSHLNKGGTGTEALSRVTGSLAFVAAARAAYIVAKDQDNDARRFFLPLKNNIGNDQTGLAFAIESATINSGGRGIETSRIAWESSVVTMTADEALIRPMDAEERGEQSDALEFLKGLLSDGPLAAGQVRRDATGAGLAWRTVHRAADRLGVAREKSGMRGGWIWRLAPEGAKTPEGANLSSMAPSAKVAPSADVEVL